MTQPEVLTTAQDAVAAAQTVVVVVSSRAELDQVATALALADALQQQGKEVLLAAPEAQQLDLLGVDQFKTELANQSLVISFPYQESSIDKVTYDEDPDSGRFSLIIKPQKGQQPLDPSTVEFTYAGIEADVVFLVGVHAWEDLEHLYAGYEDFYQRATTIVIHSFEPELGLVKLNIGNYSCFSEGMARLLQHWGWNISSEAATNLLAGIEAATQGLQSWSVTAETFEVMATLLRNGGRRTKRTTPKATTEVTTPATGSTGSLAEALRQQQRPAAVEATSLPDEVLDSEYASNGIMDWSSDGYEEAEVWSEANEAPSASAPVATPSATTKFEAPKPPTPPQQSGQSKNPKRKPNPPQWPPPKSSGDKHTKSKPNAQPPQPGSLNYQPSGMGPGGGG